MYGRSGRTVGALVVVASLAACLGGDSKEYSAEGNAMDAQANPAPSQLALNSSTEAGKEVFENICSTCHSLNPPMKEAPPLMMVVRHYMAEYGDPDSAVEAIETWLEDPASASSAMPDHAIERFGMMPPVPLSAEQRGAVAAYLLGEYSANGARQGGMQGRGQMGRGRGMGMHRADTTDGEA